MFTGTIKLNSYSSFFNQTVSSNINIIDSIEPFYYSFSKTAQVNKEHHYSTHSYRIPQSSSVKSLTAYCLIEDTGYISINGHTICESWNYKEGYSYEITKSLPLTWIQDENNIIIDMYDESDGKGSWFGGTLRINVSYK